MILGAAYKPPPGGARLHGAGDLAGARRSYETRRSKNLEFLIRRRYEWCNAFVGDASEGVELAAGIGVGRPFLRCRSMLLTDLDHGDWLDRGGVDATATPFADGQFDFVMIQNGIHHLAQPMMFFAEAARILKPGGMLLVRDVKCSLAMRAVARLTRVEGYDYDVDVFDPDAVLCDPDHLWDANNAVPDLLFDDLDELERRVPEFEGVHQSYDELLVFLNSGGVTHKTVSVPLPTRALRALAAIDRVLTRRFPNTFALQRSVVLRRR